LQYVKNGGTGVSIIGLKMSKKALVIPEASGQA